MGRTSDQYKKLLQSLFPKGKMWNRDDDSVLTKVLHGEAEELARIETRMEDLIDENISSTTSELLEWHEYEYGIEKKAINIGKTTAQRREAINAKIVARGFQNKEYFEDIADKLGYTIIIQEYTPHYIGIGTCVDPVGDSSVLFYWTVFVVIEDGINYNIERLISDITTYKPGHTLALFDFYGAEYGRGFSRGFDSIRHYDNSWVELDLSRDFDNSFANAYDYDGINYTGSYNYAFSIAYNRYSGGSYSTDDFGNGFSQPH